MPFQLASSRVDTPKRRAIAHSVSPGFTVCSGAGRAARGLQPSRARLDALRIGAQVLDGVRNHEVLARANRIAAQLVGRTDHVRCRAVAARDLTQRLTGAYSDAGVTGRARARRAWRGRS